MIWDYTEANPFSASCGNWDGACLGWIPKVIESLPGGAPAGIGRQAAAQDSPPDHALAQTPDLANCIVISSDPPYYDNIGHADLSDFFYVWQRRTLAKIHPDLFRTMLVPKAKELVASPYRHGGKKQAEAFFLTGMSAALERMAECNKRGLPATIYYAFKQSETDKNGTASTGWETFLDAALRAGFALSGTWPTRTDLGNRMNGQSTNALASSIVLVCRTREEAAGAVTRAEFRRELRAELPAALASLQRANIAAVDVAQASIGPGMAIFSRHAQVLEADGSAMTVRTALQLTNEALDEHLNAQEGEADSDTRFAVTWYEQHGFESGAFGEAETLAKARNVSVAGIVEAGIARASAGAWSVPPSWRSERTKDRLTKRWRNPGIERPEIGAWENVVQAVTVMHPAVDTVDDVNIVVTGRLSGG
jgi:putative DNA methylase